MLRLGISGPAGGRAAAPRIDLEVMIDEKGMPDMSTFRATGPGSETNQEALRTWIGSQRFQPARRDGLTVRAPFKMVLQGPRR